MLRVFHMVSVCAQCGCSASVVVWVHMHVLGYLHNQIGPTPHFSTRSQEQTPFLFNMRATTSRIKPITKTGCNKQTNISTNSQVVTHTDTHANNHGHTHQHKHT